jgi:glycosyltransferase involved in cell wall biosynthesis
MATAITARAPADVRRLALVGSSLAGGGAQRVTLTLAEGFVGRGFEVDLVVVGAHGALAPCVPPSIRVVDLRARRSTHAIPALARYLRRERPSAVLAAQSPVNLMAIAARRLSGVDHRLVVSEHVALDAVLRHAATWRERLIPAAARLLYGHADGLVVVSADTADRFAAATGFPRDRATVIHNPIVGSDLGRRAAAPLDHPWFAAGAPPVVVAAGRLTKQKDHETLLRAFAVLRGVRAARLLILGEGEERPALESLVRALGIGADVALPGFVVNPYPYFARARVLVSSSRWEGFGNVLVEAMACGTPVVSTDCPSGPAEILEHGRYGLLTPVGDARALADAMRHALQRPSPAAELRQRAQQFSVARAVDQYLDLLLP